MRYRRTFLLLFLLATFLALPPTLFAQVTTATLYGTVRDSTGAIVPGASIVATNDGTGVTREATSDAGGEFVLTALPSGTYSVKIDLQGFKSHLRKGLELGSGQTVRQTFALELGAMAETVVVEGSAPLIQTATSSQNATLGSQQVNELPVNRRNVTNLLSLAPGVTTSGSGVDGRRAQQSCSHQPVTRPASAWCARRMRVAFDLVVRNARVATASDMFDCDIGITGGRVTQLGAGLEGASREIDAAGRVVTPGGVDAHCHLDQPMEAPAPISVRDLLKPS